MPKQFSPGTHKVKAGNVARVTKTALLGGEWRLIGGIHIQDSVWKICVWTLTGTCLSFADTDIGNLVDEDEIDVPEVFL